MIEDRFDEEQFRIQLEFEEMSVEAVWTRAAEVRADRRNRGLSEQDWITFSLKLWAALQRSPLLDLEQADERFWAWCDGVGIPAERMKQEIVSTFQPGTDPEERR